MTPLNVLADELRPHVGSSWNVNAAAQCIAALHSAGFIIVDKGAIGRAQREAVRIAEEDGRDSGWRE